MCLHTREDRSLSFFFRSFSRLLFEKNSNKNRKTLEKTIRKKREGKRVFRARANRKRTIYGRLECVCVSFALCVSKKNKSITLLPARSRRRFFKSEEKKKRYQNIVLFFLKSSPNLEKDKNLVCEMVCEMVQSIKKRRHFQTPPKKS